MINEERSPYNRLGGEATVRNLVNRFYDLMETLPEAAKIRDLHPQDLTGSREKLFQFLSGWLGGPQLYMQNHGHPRLRARHLPFPISEKESDAWMLCMKTAIMELNLEDKLLEQHLIQSLNKTAVHMHNQ